MATTLLAIGTRKGLWLATSEDRRSWSLFSPHFLMTEVPSVGIDVRHGRTRLVGGAGAWRRAGGWARGKPAGGANTGRRRRPPGRRPAGRTTADPNTGAAAGIA